MKDYIRNRGDIYDEWHFMVRYVPQTVENLHDTAGYILKNDRKTTPDQELSLVMRELIALCMLSAKSDLRFAANHVRRLYRAGVTNAVIFEAAESIAPAVGHSTISLVAQAILLANDPNYPFGKMPEGGAPSELTPFPEMAMGRRRKDQAPESLMDSDEWRFIQGIDPELARRTATFVDHCLAVTPRADCALGPGVRELVAIAAICARGEVDIAAAHIRKAYAYGLSRRQVLEAISCAQNMTGAVTTQIGARAMMLAEREPG